MRKINQTQLWSDYFRLIKFNLFCLSKSIFLIISSVIFYLIPISFVLISHFLGHNIASISWIYLILIGFFVLIFINIGIFILYHLNKQNSVDVFFMAKGYKSTHLLFSKLISILFVILFNSLISAIILIILLSTLSYFNQIVSFVLMQFIGCFVTGLMLFPIFLIFCFIKNKIIYATLTFCFFLLPALSIIPRMQENNIPKMSVYDPNNGYTKIYDAATNKSYDYLTTKNQFQKDLFNKFAWSIMPAELMFSPLYYTYQINNGYINDDLSINLDFISNINNIDFDEKNNYVNFNASNSLFLRSLDSNIYELNNSEAKKLISNAINEVYKYAINDLNLNDKLNELSQWDTSNAFNAYNFILLLEKMFLSSNTTLFYVYQLIRVSYYKQDDKWPEINSILKQKADFYKQALIDACSDHQEFKNFIESTIKNGKYATVLDYSLIKYRIEKTYPTGLNITNDKAKLSDVEYLINECFDLTGSVLDLNLIKLKRTRFITNTGVIDKSTIDFNFNKFIDEYFIKKYPIQANQIFGKPGATPSDSFWIKFIHDGDIIDINDKKPLDDLNNWNPETFKTFIYLLSGNDYKHIKASDFMYTSADKSMVWGSYYAINVFIEALNNFLSQDKDFQSKISNNENNFERGFVNIETFSFNPNNNTNPNYNSIIKQYGQLKQQTYNNLLTSSLISTSISIIAYIWIIYFIIQKSKTKND